ncbi:MAG: kinase [Methyloprofundus sp.]|nr:kinase [Methyloprofundus sp.]
MDIANFLEQHALPEHYAREAEQWFYPVAEQIYTQQQQLNKAMVLGINGSQGSGKSTLAALFVLLFKQIYQLNAVSISIDDFYFTLAEREQLAQHVHPLMATRGVPGTHDIDLANKTLRQLLAGTSEVLIPRFNKALDNRYAQDQWAAVNKPVDIIILEGWCLGAEAQSAIDLKQPINALEANEDADCLWREYVNQQLDVLYPCLFQHVDQWLMLQAPSFDCVYQWRLEQEHKLRDRYVRQGLSRQTKIMQDAEVKRFISFYQRITENLLVMLPAQVDYLFKLDEQRRVRGF